MKRLFFCLMAMFAITACTDDGGVDNGGDVDNGGSQSPSITLSATSLSVASDNTEATISFTSTTAWSAEVTEGSDWCTINPTSGAAGSAKIAVTAVANESYEGRSATVVIKAGDVEKSVTIKQMQKGAIIVADSEYEFDHTGGELDFEIQTNVDFTVTISDNATEWIQQVDTRALETKTLHFNIASNSLEEDREGTITISGDGVTQTVKIKQTGTNISELLEKQRKALIAIYKATNGDNWKNNTNWCSDKPITEWYGVMSHGEMMILDLSNNNLSGSLPEEIGNLVMFQAIYMEGNNLQGMIPSSIGHLKDLESLSITGVFSGPLPSEIGNLSKLKYLSLSGLKGNIPNEIGMLRSLETLSLVQSRIDGGLPSSIGNLQKLNKLVLHTSNLTGNIPKEIGNLSNLKFLDLSYNQLTGGIPKELSKLQNIDFISIRNNRLTGRIPSEIMELPWWQKRWGLILPQQEDYGFSSEGIEIYASQFSMSSLSGKTMSNAIFTENEYTVLYNFTEDCTYAEVFTPKLVRLYNLYKDKGLGIFSSVVDQSEDRIQAYIDRHNISWEVIIEEYDTSESSWLDCKFANYYASSPFVAVFDQTGKIVFNSALRHYEELSDFLVEVLGAPDNEDDEMPDYYESTDYSKDGVVKTLQTATKGDGIDIVLMGDAYSDRLIADGTYDNAMNTAMEKFFAVEPYKSFRNHFNVYSVTAVSQNEVYSDATSTVFEGYFGEEQTHVGGNNEKVFDYATKAISEELIDEALIVVMMNSPAYAGTCYMYGPSEGDWGDGASVSYFPVGVNDEALAQVLHHEAGGHGFAKLGDEYAYQENGTISGSEIADAQNMATYGWWKNVDFTSDPTAVKWSHFLSDARYASEGLGVYEGAYTYWSGAFRPTQNSIMNTNVGGFNAPSREAIYYRIHKLAYGSSWQYDYEEFVEWDAKNRVTSSATRGVPYRLDIPDNFQPTHPPVVIKKSWREAMNE